VYEKGLYERVGGKVKQQWRAPARLLALPCDRKCLAELGVNPSSEVVTNAPIVMHRAAMLALDRSDSQLLTGKLGDVYGIRVTYQMTRDREVQRQLKAVWPMPIHLSSSQSRIRDHLFKTGSHPHGCWVGHNLEVIWGKQVASGSRATHSGDSDAYRTEYANGARWFHRAKVLLETPECKSTIAKMWGGWKLALSCLARLW
jgi:hypothetical protein